MSTVEITVAPARWERSPSGTHYVAAGPRELTHDHLIAGAIALCGEPTNGHGYSADEIRISDLHRACSACIDQLINLNTGGTP